MIEIYSKTKVYIASPARFATGGPELLHQLAYNLRNHLNIDAYIYYYPANIEDPVHPEYKMYNVPFVREIEDDFNNLLIVPESMPAIKLLQSYKNIRKVIWWLSIDNFYLGVILGSKRKFFFRRAINKIFKTFFDKIIFDISELVSRNLNSVTLPRKILNNIKSVDFHLVQSYYALNHLKVKIGISDDKIYYLSDYLNIKFLEAKNDLNKKENIVTFNPKKGISFTKKIIKNSENIMFVPLINMTRDEVIQTLQKAKVYIDFGNHPGKDRIPREAAILGCCVITGKRGSAAFYEDVPIPDEYKFEDKEESIPKIINKIKDCFDNYEERYKDFEYYRQIIRQEPEKFISDMKKIFVKV